MASAIMTTIGLENYLSGENKSLFDLLNLPDGIDKEVLTGSILMRQKALQDIRKMGKCFKYRI